MRALCFAIMTLSTVAAADTLPTYPEAPLGDGETSLNRLAASTVEWLSGDGTPVRVRAFFKDGKVVIRGYTSAGPQDIVTSALEEPEFHLFDHENGKTFGIQLHEYVDGKPDLYEGWSVELKGGKFKVVKKARFNGKQPTPSWLYDNVNVPYSKRVVHGIKVLRWAAHRRDANAYGKYFDGGTVKVTSNSKTEDVIGTDLFAKFGGNFPVLGHNAKCKGLCCTTGSKELAPFVHVAAVCFDADPKDDINTFPHVRAITIVQP